MRILRLWIGVSLVSLVFMMGCSSGQGASTSDDSSEETIAQLPSPTPATTEAPTATPQPTPTEEPVSATIDESDGGIITSDNPSANNDAAGSAGSITCSPVTSWPVYTVVSGDTLSRIAARTDSSISDLATANCIDDPGLLTIGQQLYVPRQPDAQAASSDQTTTNAQQPASDNTTVTNNDCRVTLIEQTTVMDSPESTSRNPIGSLSINTVIVPVAYKSLPYYGVHYGIAFGDGYGWVSAPDEPACTSLPDTLPNEETGDDPVSDHGYTCYYTPQQPIGIRTFPKNDEPVTQTLTAGVTYEVKSDGMEGWYYVEATDPFVSGWAQFTPSGNCADLPINPYFCTFIATTEATVYAQSNEGARVMGTLAQGEERRFTDFGPAYTGEGEATYWIRIVYTAQRAIQGFVRNTDGVLQGRCPTR